MIFVTARYALLSSLLLAVATASGQAQNAVTQLPHNPDHGPEALNWCAAHMARKEVAPALSDCDYAVAQNPKNAAAWSNRGSLWLVVGEFARAIVDFNEAIAIAPLDASLLFNRGIAHAGAGARERAIADYSSALKLDPSLAIAHHNRGYEHELAGRRAQARDDYRAALNIDPSLKPSVEGLKRLTADL
jgi:tetratricopeptide (TPR) repeat protein